MVNKKSMIQLYLIINVIVYLLLATWCLIKPTVSANAIGYGFLNNSGKVEYLVVYAGLEYTIALFLALAAYFPSMRFSGLVFCVLLYILAMIIRPVAAMSYGNIDKVTYITGAVEYALGIWGIVLVIIELRKTNTVLL